MAGSSSVRTTKVSMRTETTRTHAIWLSVGVVFNSKPHKAIAMINQADRKVECSVADRPPLCKHDHTESLLNLFTS